MVFKIIQLDGKLVNKLKEEYQDPGIYYLSYDVSELKDGMYICLFQTENRIETSKFLVEGK